ncbi:hypothetical protein HGP28_14035 [Vibrio sp. SM6]|uniref:Uncharacterized protein n=1 Tax=Vibrio agarilyticus TaxID=2726741 RepID=A0A7X8TSI1_9VIBR|nr:hypothetical protein [Vibrio agarilyticus]NLS14009.1 hypothetical protein [Vibrio agarilyticus]
MQEKAEKILDYISANPDDCTIAEPDFDVGVFRDLKSQGLVEGIDGSSDGGGMFFNVRMTLKGEQYLAQIKASKPSLAKRFRSSINWTWKGVCVVCSVLATVVSVLAGIKTILS